MIHQFYTASVQRNITNFIPVNCNFQNYLFRFGHLMERTVLVRVYSGSVAAPQPGLFKTATAKLPKSVLSSTRFEYCSKENARRWNWSPMELMAWLCESDIHFILTHPHQGTSWDCREVYEAIEILRNHPGFPSGQQLDCPVFRQDKFTYVYALKEITIPTFKMTLDISLGVEDQLLSLYIPLENFCRAHNENEGWVVKLPFITHSEGIDFVKTFDGIMERFEFLMKNFSRRIPYAMVQPKLCNRKEYRIVVRKGKAEYTVPITVGVSVHFPPPLIKMYPIVF